MTPDQISQLQGHVSAIEDVDRRIGPALEAQQLANDAVNALTAESEETRSAYETFMWQLKDDPDLFDTAQAQPSPTPDAASDATVGVAAAPRVPDGELPAVSAAPVGEPPFATSTPGGVAEPPADQPTVPVVDPTVDPAASQTDTSADPTLPQATPVVPVDVQPTDLGNPPGPPTSTSDVPPVDTVETAPPAAAPADSSLAPVTDPADAEEGAETWPTSGGDENETPTAGV